MFHALKYIFIIGALALAIPACTPEPRKDNLTNATEKCEARTFQTLLWKPRSALKQLTLPSGTRIILSGQTVTMDYRPNRLNIAIGKLDRIEKVYCG